MAPPSLTATETLQESDTTLLKKLDSSSYKAGPYNHHVVRQEGYKYAHLLPQSDGTLQLDPLSPFRHEDPGSRVKEPLTNPLNGLLGQATINEITPLAGSEVSGVQLSKLDDAQRDELAAYVARRRVVVFRDQDFADQSNDFFKTWTSYFGRPHIHPTSAHPVGIPEIHLVYKDGKTKSFQEQRQSLTSVAIHSDVTYELQPPGLTTFFILSIPGNGTSGGDTVFVDAVEAYNRLSEPFKKRLEGLEVVHSGFEQADYARAAGKAGHVRREPVEHVHPLVRTHPVTGERALFVNPQFSRSIVGFKKEESEAVLGLLYRHIAQGIDFHVRIKYAPGSVVLWDNRITSHTAILDYGSDGFRHAARLTPQAERPFLRPLEQSS